MYLKLALRNVKKSYKDYLIYFLTLTISICIFYSFNTFSDQRAVTEILTKESSLMYSMPILMNFLSIFISIILGFLILFANHFLIKRRKKEFGIYMLQGMEPKNMSKIVIYETMIIGVLSLITGILAGILVSQLLSAFTAQLFIANVSRFYFFFSWHGLIMTLVSFSIIFIVVLIFNILILRHFKLIDLLNANKQNERMLIRSIPLNIFIFIISLCFIGVAYQTILKYGFIQIFNVDIIINGIAFVLICGSIGTFLFFLSLSGFLLQMMKLSKTYYYRKLHMFSLRQLHSTMNSSFTSMSVICIMLLISIGALSSALNLNQTLSKSMAIVSPVDLTIDGIYSDQFKNVGPMEILKYYDAPFLDKVDKSSLIREYASIDMNIKELFPYIKSENRGAALENKADFSINLVYESDYNDFRIMRKEDPISLHGNDCYLLTSDEFLINNLNEVINHRNIEIAGHPFNIKNKEIEYVQLFTNEFSPSNSITLVMPNDRLASFFIDDSYISYLNMNFIEDYSYKHFEKDMKIFTDKFTDNVDENDGYRSLSYSTSENVLMERSSLSVAFSYVGIYVGTIFILASAVILALHQISQAEENRMRYQILMKIGCDHKMINRSILHQLSVYFLLPLSLAIVHSYVGIKVVDDVIVTLGKTQIYEASLITGLIIILIYGFYFYATYASYKRILKRDL